VRASGAVPAASIARRFCPGEPGQLDHDEADDAAAEDRDGLPGRDPRDLYAVQAARDRFAERAVQRVERRWHS
jgi:hypothetical protein